jgi:hypothetical protein
VVVAPILVAVLAFTLACGDDDGGSATDAPAASNTQAAGETIDLETFTAGDEYTLGLQEVSGSGVTGTAVFTGVADGDVSIAVDVDGLAEGGVNLYGGLSSCPAAQLPADAEAILTLAPLSGGRSETSPVGVSTETFSGENIFVFSGPWAVIVEDEAAAPVACGIIPQD